MTYDYNCLMLNFDLDWWEDFVTNLIDPNDIYDNEQGEYGLETEPHVTILYGLFPDIKFSYLQNRLPNLFRLAVTFTTISSFNKDEYDVLKLTAKSDELNKIHFDLRKNFKNNTSYINYNPHMTIAYLKPGTAIKYKKKLTEPFKLVPDYYKYSYTDGNYELYDSNSQVLEQLAELEHNQWMQWASNIMETENISDDRTKRWYSTMVPYIELTEEQKEQDREWARKALEIFSRNYEA